MPPDPDYSTSTEGSGKPPETAPVSPERGSFQNRDRPCDAVPLERESVQSENTLAAANPHLLRGTAQSISLIETSVLIVPEGPLDPVEPQRDQLLSSGSSRLANYIYQLASPSQIKLEQQERKFQSTKTRPIASPKLAIKVLSQEEFKSTTPSLRRNPNRSGHLIADPPVRHLYVFEVLLKESVAPESNPMRTRTIAHNPQKATVPHNPNQKEIPDRIRVRSTFMLNLLHHITDVKLDHSGGDISVNERTTLLFLYPFKFFMTYLHRIKDVTNRLRTKFRQPGQTNPSRVSNNTAMVDSPAQIPGDASTSLETTMEDNYESKKALDHLRLLSRLLLTHLSPIFILRNSYQSGTYDTVSFQDLWLLFEVGGLAFLREPLPGHPPSIVRVTHFNGGRQLLNNGEFRSPEPRQDVNGPNSKGKENRFNIHYYSLNFDGEYYGPVEDGLSIPPWEGTRSVYDLKLFPLVFYNGFVDRKFESLKELRDCVISRGKSFVRLGAINHKRYNGQGIGTHHEFYNSPVMIDFKLQRQDTESRLGLSGLTECVLKSESGLATGLSIYPGDPREVLEGTPRANNPMECVFPGCDDNDFIHDDILLDNLIAGQKIERYGISSVRFSRSEVRQLSELDYALFPTFVQGYVLNNRVWAKLALDLLEDFEGTGGQLDALHIPERHKESLLALVDMEKTRSFSRLALDVVPGKGQGIIILLHGRPGLGKTATAEAMAADMNRPLYPITYADLGNIPSAIETNLKKIFRYCQRWDCIVLLDEADVFLMPRDREDTKRNSIVSIFLRNFEWYPGIIFLTTNRLDQFDEGVLDRIHLKLRYSKLSNDFTKNIFNDLFTKINQSDMPRMGAPTGEHKISRSDYGVTVKEKHMSQIHTWREEQFSKAGKVGWWNGRQIRVAFQLASAFARREMVNAGKDGTASIKLRHFVKVLELYDSFTTDLADAQDGNHDE